MINDQNINSINKTLLHVGDSKPINKRSLVSRSGKQFESIDHYIAESLIQNFYPKNNKDDFELVKEDDSSLPPNYKKNEEDEEKKQRNWIQRTCGPLNPGSLRGSIFAMMSTALGAGLFALPKALFLNCGFLIGLIFVIACGLITLLSLNLLMRCSIKANRLNYPDLAEHCFGKLAGKTIQWALIVYVFGVICGYQIIISEFFLQLIGSDWGWIDYECKDYTCKIRDIQIVLTTFIVLPISLLRNFYALRHVTIFGVFAILYAILVVVVETPNSSKSTNGQDNFQYVHWDWNLFTGYTSALFAFTCYTVVFPIRMELTNPIEKRITKIFNRSVFVEIILYLLLAISGYFSIYNDANPADLIIQKSSSIPMVLTRIVMILFFFIAIPININPGRAQVINFLNGTSEQTEFNKKQHLIVTAVFLFGPCVIGIFFPKINSVFSFLGGACSTLFGVTFPGLMFVKLNENKWNSVGNLSILAVVIFLTVSGYIAALFSLLGAFDAIKF